MHVCVDGASIRMGLLTSPKSKTCMFTIYETGGGQFAVFPKFGGSGWFPMISEYV